MIPIYRTSGDLMREIALSFMIFSLRERLLRRIRSFKERSIICGQFVARYGFLLEVNWTIFRIACDPVVAANWIFAEEKIASKCVLWKREKNLRPLKCRYGDNIAESPIMPGVIVSRLTPGEEDSGVEKIRKCVAMRNPLIAFFFHAHLRVIERELNARVRSSCYVRSLLTRSVFGAVA